MTSGKTTRPSCILLDADVVIAAHEQGIWHWLTTCYRVFIPSVVVRSEALYYHPVGSSDTTVPIELPVLVEEGIVAELSATAEEMALVYAMFVASFAGRLHPGEIEGLALMFVNKISSCGYCSGDACAIRAMAMLGLADQGVSLEKLLAGKKPRGRLEVQFTEGYFRGNTKLGKENRITGEGLVKGLLD